jgi:hypothetical protein
MELKKILTGNFGAELTLKMYELNLFTYFGITEKANVDEFKRVSKLSRDLNIVLHHMTLLSAFLYSSDQVLYFTLYIKNY